MSDVEWLTLAGSEGWVVLTRDKNIRLREIERNALVAAGVAAFVFTGGNVSGVEMTEAIVSALPRMEKHLAAHQPPFICRIATSGDVERIFPPAE